MASRNGDADVIVVGAGAAGLAAARIMARAGRCVTVIEARERIGGRIYTRHAATAGAGRTVPVELGAEFVHGLPEISWSLIRGAQLTTCELQGTSYCFDGTHLEVCGQSQSDSFSVLRRIKGWLEDRPQGSDISFEGFLQADHVDETVAGRAAAYVEGFNAADRRIVSCVALNRQRCAEDQVQGDRIFHLRSGYDALPRHLAEGLSSAGGNILLGCPVREVRWTRGSVCVAGTDSTGSQFRFNAPQAIVTLPLGVLQANTVHFDPQPPQMASRMNSLVMGEAERVTLMFDRRFWQEKAPGLSFLFAAGELIPTWWTLLPQATPMITGWAAGAGAMSRWRDARIEGLPTVRSAALKTLGRVFGVGVGELERWLVDAHHHGWRADEFSLGSYSYVRTGQLEASRLWSTPVENTLFFAGEHTDLENQWGTVHAALASGQRAAAQSMETPIRRF